MRFQEPHAWADAPEHSKPLTVSVKTARRLLSIGNTKMWELIKTNRVKTISIGRRRLVILASLEALLAYAPERVQ